MTAHLNFIGQIRTPYKTLNDCPGNVQPDGPECEVVLYREYATGLTGLRSDQKVLLLYWFEGVRRADLLQNRCGQIGGDPVGVFSLRSPHRPNPIAASVVTIEQITDERITVRGLDCLDGTKLLDIKPS